MPWFAIFLLIGTTILSALLAKHPKDATPAANGDFQVPTAEEGRPIPVVFGTCELRGPNVVWWGDLRIDPIKKSSGGFLGIGAKKVTIGYKYFAGMMLALCHGPIDSLSTVKVSDKDTEESQAVVGSPEDYIRVSINKPDLFGGTDREGGISGDCDFYRGLQTQNSNDYLTARWATTAPAYRGLCYMVLRQVYLGTSQYIKNWSFIVKRCPAHALLDSTKRDISGDANAAHVIFEIMTSTDYGLGIPTSRFDVTSFRTVASTLYTEGLGVSLILDSENSADAVITDLLRTVAGLVYTDPATGLFTMKLIRADYDPATLTEFTVDDLDEAPAWSRGMWSETLNEIKVEYTDRAANFQTRVVQAQESANYATQAALASDTIQFKAISNATNANTLAMRELKVLSYPVAKFRIKVNRKGWALRPGSPFKLTWNPPSGTAFSGMVLRLTSIRYGDLGDPSIEIEAVEDIFAVAATAYPVPGGTGWVDPIGPPVAAAAQDLEEAPYHFVGEERWMMLTAARADSTSFAAEIWVDEGSGYVKGNDLPSLTPSGVLASAYSQKTAALDAVGFTLAAGGVDFGRLVAASTDAAGRSRGENLAYFADTGEVVSWTTAVLNGDGTLTVSGNLRGVLDTVPTDHAGGVRVWFMSEGVATTKETAYSADLTVTAKVLPKNALGSIPLSSASALVLATSSRAWKPYPAGNAKVNALDLASWPSTTVGDASLTWSHRNRVAQGTGGAMVPQDTAGSYSPEGTYTVEVLVGATVKQTYTGISGTSQSYTGAQRVADDADGTKAVTMRIKPINGSYTGTLRTPPAFTMTGFGMTFGNYFGGIQA